MKKISKLKLNQLAKNELEQRAMNVIRGGGCGTCSCSCSCSCSCKKEDAKAGVESDGCNDTGRENASTGVGMDNHQYGAYGGYGDNNNYA